VIAGALDEIVKACALAAQNEDTIAGEVELVVIGFAALVETDDPEILLLELLEGADEIDDAGDAKVFCCASAGFDGNGAKWRGAALGEHDDVDACAVRNAEQRAEVLRVFDAIEREDEARLAGSLWLEEIFDGEELCGANDGYDTLVCGGAGELGEVLARFLADTDVRLAAGFDEALDAGRLSGFEPLAGDHDVVKASAAGLYSFFDGMDAVESLHVSSVKAYFAEQIVFRALELHTAFTCDGYSESKKLPRPAGTAQGLLELDRGARTV
jgi:hypothetical protein